MRDVLRVAALKLRVNGIEHELELDPRMSLLDTLREHILFATLVTRAAGQAARSDI